jgi:hypothetical protein
MLVHGRWFSPGTPASSTTKTGRHDIAESGVKTPKIKSNQPKKQNLSVCVCIKSHDYFPSLFFFLFCQDSILLCINGFHFSMKCLTYDLIVFYVVCKCNTSNRFSESFDE